MVQTEFAPDASVQDTKIPNLKNESEGIKEPSS